MAEGPKPRLIRQVAPWTGGYPRSRRLGQRGFCPWRPLILPHLEDALAVSTSRQLRRPVIQRQPERWDRIGRSGHGVDQECDGGLERDYSDGRERDPQRRLRHDAGCCGTLGNLVMPAERIHFRTSGGQSVRRAAQHPGKSSGQQAASLSAFARALARSSTAWGKASPKRR